MTKGQNYRRQGCQLFKKCSAVLAKKFGRWEHFFKSKVVIFIVLPRSLMPNEIGSVSNGNEVTGTFFLCLSYGNDVTHTHF
jgi:hypothetical protein